MAYTKTLWTNGETALSDVNMNHIEQGIKDAHDFMAQLVDSIYPVNSIYISVEDVNPATRPLLAGTTWVKWGAGKVPVGVDTTDTDFDTVEESGGAKTKSYTPAGTVGNTTLTADQSGNQAQTITSGGMSANSSHSHGAFSWIYGYNTTNSGSVEYKRIYSYSQQESKAVTSATSTAHTHSVTVAAKNAKTAHTHGFTGTASQMNVLQPYITCYMWKRTS